jgi:ppGpp synthetase/RelA/SpoT-type nucleotidyltranferase
VEELRLLKTLVYTGILYVRVLEPASIQLQIRTLAQTTADELRHFVTYQRKSVTAKIKIHVNAAFK